MSATRRKVTSRKRRPARKLASRRQKSRIRKRSPLWSYLGKGLIVSVLLAILSAAGIFTWSFVEAKASEMDSDFILFSLNSSDLEELATRLEDEGLIDSAWLMTAYLNFLTPGTELREGSHLLRRGLSPRSLVQRLSGQRSRGGTQVTIPEGWNYFQIAQRLEEREVTSRLSFESAAVDVALLKELKIHRGSAEGYLFPATYQFLVDSDARDVVRRLVKETRKRIQILRSSSPAHEDLTKLQMGEVEILTLASIVERETAVAAESPRIARVFLNRLLSPSSGTRGRLQSDPTAGYGCLVDPAGAPSCVGYRGRVTPRMLGDVANPYNTYRHAGLPPGPISNPGEQSIIAILHPAEGDELYFVADGKGGHSFSRSYEEHQRAVERLKRSIGR